MSQHAASKRGVPKQTGAPPAQTRAAAPRQAEKAPSPAETVPRLTQTASKKTKKNPTLPRTVSKQAGPTTQRLKRTTTKREIIRPPPPPKYPAIAQLKNEFWDMAERVNHADPYGKLSTRAARNAMSGVLTSPAFWAAATALAGKLNETTRDPALADSYVRVCDGIAYTLTRPSVLQDYGRVVDQMYAAASGLDLSPYVVVMRDAIDAVEQNKVDDVLGRVDQAVQAVQLDPAAITRAFDAAKKCMDKTPTVTMNSGVSNGITKLSMLLNRNGGDQ